MVRENAALDIRAGRFSLARAQLDRVLAITPRDPVAHLHYGDLYRIQSQRVRALSDKDTLVRKAIDQYTEAARLDPAYPRLKPDAPDARRIKE